ncbi:amidohydrolase [Chitinibacter fontanus]|uniref:Amidohydrolase n=2 Tax=Chitinibacter fontanus TaxID=1737446 RepID=A0A7D5ZGL4_9NEIS|nr:amidohydrolase [Chitinibacter fontanus]
MKLPTLTVAMGLMTSMALAGADFADTIYSGGDIVTVNELQAYAEAVAVKDGKIVAVGARDEVMKYQGKKTKVVDLQGKTLIPGFMDAHGHVFNAGIQALSANLLAAPDGQVSDIASLQQTLRDWVAKPENKKLGVILGFGYDDSQLREGRHPTRQDLDAVSKDVPILIIHQSGHLGVMNSKAFELMGVNSQTKDPAGGKFRREEGSQQPNGVMEETAFFGLLFPMFAKLSPKDNEIIFNAGIDIYSRFGYTTAQEGRASSSSVKTMYGLAQKNKLKLDVVAYPDIQTATDVIKAPYLSKTYHNGFRVGGAKLNLDGSPQGKTAWLTQPYFVPPEGQKQGYAGYPSMKDADALRYVEMAFKNNWQLLTHVNGDAAIDQLIGAVKQAEAKLGKADRRPIAIHAQTARLDQVESFKELGIMPSFFPMHTFYWGDWHKNSVLGVERAANISPTGWALARDMIFTSHHDAPVAFPDSMRVYSATVNRVTRSGEVLGPEHRVSPLVGLKTQTLWAAYQYFENKSKGSIEVGKNADLVVLSANPLKVDPMTIVDIKVEQTIKDGKPVFTRQADSKNAMSCFESDRCYKLASHTLAAGGVFPHVHYQ